MSMHGINKRIEPILGIEFAIMKNYNKAVLNYDMRILFSQMLDGFMHKLSKRWEIDMTWPNTDFRILLVGVGWFLLATIFLANVYSEEHVTNSTSPVTNQEMLEKNKRILETDPENLQALFNVADMLKVQDFVGSKNALNKILEINPDNQKAIAQKIKLLNTPTENRMFGHAQMVLRNGEGHIVGYIESDVLLVNHSDQTLPALLKEAETVETLFANEKEFYSVKSHHTADVVRNTHPMLATVSGSFFDTQPQSEPIEYKGIVVRINGIIVQYEDVLEMSLRSVFPK